MTDNLDCARARRLLPAYLDGELRDEQRWRVTEHLARCSQCWLRVRFETRLRAHLTDLGQGAVPWELERRIRSFITRCACL
jgi:anti-sigma factor (TIGR02949 family)